MRDKATPHHNIQDALLLDGDTGSLLEYYRKWSKTYDADVIENYFGLSFICELMHRHVKATNQLKNTPADSISVIDIGCGTGLLGKPLHQLGYRNIDGVDLSEQMIEKAQQSGYYQNLYAGINIHDQPPMDIQNTYDVAICIGVFTPGHIQAKSLFQIVKMIKPGGLIVTSTRIPYYESTDFQAISDKLQSEGKARLLAQYMDAPYRDDGDAHYWVYEVH